MHSGEPLPSRCSTMPEGSESNTRTWLKKTGPLVDIERSEVELKHSAQSIHITFRNHMDEEGISAALCRTEALRCYVVAGPHVKPPTSDTISFQITSHLRQEPKAAAGVCFSALSPVL